MTDINSGAVLYSDGKNDEHHTPWWGVAPILRYVRPGTHVWCPFDQEHSNYVQMLREHGCTVIASHIDDGQDFFDWEPTYWEVMISNPPFSEKRRYFERALSFRKPFALLMTMTWMNDAGPVLAFGDHQPQILKFDKRIHFSGEKKTTFSSGYFCWNFLPRDLIFENLEVPK